MPFHLSEIKSGNTSKLTLSSTIKDSSYENYTENFEESLQKGFRDIANMYNWGWSVNKDGQKAIEWYKKAGECEEVGAFHHIV